MLPDLNLIKGIHPGAVLKRELKKREIKSIDFSNEIDEYPQTINAITNERRGINPKLSIKLGKYFNVDVNYFMFLQAAYEVNSIIKAQDERHVEKLKGLFRESIFWDTRIKNIDIKKHKRSIIQRVLERGNAMEIRNLIKLYSLGTIKKELPKLRTTRVSRFKENVEKYIINNP